MTWSKEQSRTMDLLLTGYGESAELKNFGGKSTLTAGDKNLLQGFCRFMKKNGLMTVPNEFPSTLYS